MDTNFLLNAGTKIINDMMQSVKSDNQIMEPDLIDSAIAMYEKRLQILREMKNDGFKTISSYNEYQRAKEIVERYKK